MSQIVERFAGAVEALVGDGPVKNRLNRAYSAYLEDLQQIELPVANKSDFGKLHSALHSGPAVGRADTVTASVQKMSVDEARTHARTIVQLYAELLTLDTHGRSRIGAVADQVTDKSPGIAAGSH